MDAEALWRAVQPLLLALPRVTALFLVVPLLVPQAVPALARNAVVLSFSLALYPFMAAHLPAADTGTYGWLGLVAKELLVGGLIGYGVALLLWALQGAGALIDTQAGLAHASLMDPFGGHAGGVFGPFLGLFGALLFLACGGLYVMLSLLFESYRLWPPGEFTPRLGPELAAHGLQGLADVTGWMLRLALPLLALLLVVELGIALLGRAVPQLNVFYFSMPIKAALAALMLALCLAFWLDFMRSQLAALPALAARVGQALGL